MVIIKDDFPLMRGPHKTSNDNIAKEWQNKGLPMFF